MQKQFLSKNIHWTLSIIWHLTARSHASEASKFYVCPSVSLLDVCSVTKQMKLLLIILWHQKGRLSRPFNHWHVAGSVFRTCWAATWKERPLADGRTTDCWDMDYGMKPLALAAAAIEPECLPHYRGHCLGTKAPFHVYTGKPVRRAWSQHAARCGTRRLTQPCSATAITQ